MSNNEIIIMVLEIVGLVVSYMICSYTYHKSKNTSKEYADKIIVQVENTILSVVQYTNQTYVDSLKASGKFDKEAQKIAFDTTKEKVLSLLQDYAVTTIQEIYGDLDTYIEVTIEDVIKRIKKW